MTESAFIELGSNIDPSLHLPEAVRHLVRVGQVRRLSRVYHSAAVGPAGQPDFTNAAALLETPLDPSALREELKTIELALGRVRTADKFAPRVIDLDLTLYGSLVLDHGPLRLPSPDLLERAYLAVIMAELSPGFNHPETGETLAEIAARLSEGVALEVDPSMTEAIQRAAGLGK